MSLTKNNVNINKIIAVPIWLGIYFGLIFFLIKFILVKELYRGLFVSSNFVASVYIPLVVMMFPNVYA